MDALQAIYTDFRNAGAEVVVFSGELPELSRGLATKQGLAFPIVQDVNLAIAEAYGIAFTLSDAEVGVMSGFGIDVPKNTGMATWTVPMPARFVIDKAGIIRAADVDPDYTVRPEPEATLAVVKGL